MIDLSLFVNTTSIHGERFAFGLVLHAVRALGICVVFDFGGDFGFRNF